MGDGNSGARSGRGGTQMLYPMVSLTLEAVKRLLRAFGALEEIPEATGTGGAVG